MPMAPAPMTMMSFGCCRQHHRLLAANDARSIEGKARHLAADNARGNQDIRAFDLALLAVLVRDLDHACFGNRRDAADVIHFVLLEKQLDAAGQLVGNLAAAADDLVPVELHPVHLQAEVVGVMSQELKDLRVLEQRLGGNAAPVETGAARAIHFHAGYFFPELPRANRSHISGRSAANDNQIIIGHNIIWVFAQNEQNLALEGNESVSEMEFVEAVVLLVRWSAIMG